MIYYRDLLLLPVAQLLPLTSSTSTTLYQTNLVDNPYWPIFIPADKVPLDTGDGVLGSGDNTASQVNDLWVIGHIGKEGEDERCV